MIRRLLDRIWCLWNWSGLLKCAFAMEREVGPANDGSGCVQEFSTEYHVGGCPHKPGDKIPRRWQCFSPTGGPEHSAHELRCPHGPNDPVGYRLSSTIDIPPSRSDIISREAPE